MSRRRSRGGAAGEFDGVGDHRGRDPAVAVGDGWGRGIDTGLLEPLGELLGRQESPVEASRSVWGIVSAPGM